MMTKRLSFTLILFAVLSFSNRLFAQGNQQLLRLSIGNTSSSPASRVKLFALKASASSNLQLLPYSKLHQEKASLYEIAPSDSVTRNGEKSLRFELNRTDSLVSTSKRCEMVVAVEPNITADRWYGFGVFLPSSFVPDMEPEIISQLHANPDKKHGAIWRSPPIALMTTKGGWIMNIIGAASTDTANVKDEKRKSVDLGPAQTNAWTDWVFHVKWSNGDDGLVEVWKNGTKIQEIHGADVYNKIVSTFWKIGIYKWAWTKHYDRGRSVVAQRIVYFDNVRTLNGPSTYEEFAQK